MGKIIRNGISFSGAVIDTANNINYDNSISGLEAKTTQEAIDEINETVEEINENLGGLRFGVDGEGNYGYFGADDSLIPFKSGKVNIINLCSLTSSAQSINLTQYSGYENFKIGENLIIAAVSAKVETPAWEWYRPYSPSISLNLSYNASTGILTVPAARTAYNVTDRDGDSQVIAMSASGYVYLIY